MNKTYKGWIEEKGYTSEGECIYLSEHEDPLVNIILEDMACYGNYLTVRYWICDKETTKEKAQENFIRRLYGESDGVLSDAYSDITGYLWTDEELNIGGHNLMDELHSYVPSIFSNKKELKYCILEIEYNKELNQ